MGDQIISAVLLPGRAVQYCFPDTVFSSGHSKIDWRPGDQMDNDVVIMTACNQAYFPLCVDLIDSIRTACGFVPRIRVLDLGLLPNQIATLRSTVEKIIEPDWDVGKELNLPTWYRAMTARPFLPKYAGCAPVIVWVDCDAWLQRYAPLQSLINAAREGKLAIVKERFGKGFTVNIRTQQGLMDTHCYDAESVKANVRTCYERCFDSDVAAAFGDLPSFNSGVFALRSDAPAWTVWQEIFAHALAKNYDFLAEQQALNVGIRRGVIPISEQPQEANYVCHLELPWYSSERGAFTFPNDESRILGTIHLADTKKYSLLPISHFPHGICSLMPLAYNAVQKLSRAKPVMPN